MLFVAVSRCFAGSDAICASPRSPRPAGQEPGVWRRPSAAGTGAPSVAPEIWLANQNLLHVVFRYGLSTKHSRSIRRVQAFFHAQNWPNKTGVKTGFWAWIAQRSPAFAPEFHCLVHRRAIASVRPTNLRPTLQFYDRPQQRRRIRYAVCTRIHACPDLPPT